MASRRCFACFVVAPEGGAAGSCFAAALVLNAEADPGYGQARWQVDAAPDEVLVVHVLATLPEFHGCGFARQLLEGAIAAAREAGARALRLDTFTDNVRAQRLYESAVPACCTSSRCSGGRLRADGSLRRLPRLRSKRPA